MELIIPEYFDPLNEAAYNHFFRRDTGTVVELCPGDQFVVLRVQALEHGLPFVAGALCRLAVLLQRRTFRLGLRNQGGEQFL